MSGVKVTDGRQAYRHRKQFRCLLLKQLQRSLRRIVAITVLKAEGVYWHAQATHIFDYAKNWQFGFLAEAQLFAHVHHCNFLRRRDDHGAIRRGALQVLHNGYVLIRCYYVPGGAENTPRGACRGAYRHRVESAFASKVSLS